MTTDTTTATIPVQQSEDPRTGEQQPDPTEALVGRLFEAVLGTMDLYAIGLGGRLGLYAALHEHGPATSTELAARTGIAERYAREWLEQQAVTGFLQVVSDGGAQDRRYALPESAVPVLLDPTSPAHMAPIAAFVPPLGQVFDRIVDAYRTGDGIAWSEFPADVVEAQAAFNRPAFTHELGGWLAAIPEIDARLRSGPSLVADLACGGGWSSQAIAARYPEAVVRGFDIDDTSIALARRLVAGTDVEGRVEFEVCDLSEPDDVSYDAAMMFEALHDLSHPVRVLTSARKSLVPGGVLLVVDERAAEQFTAPGDPFERLFYGSSVLICLPGSLADGGVGTGAAIRPSTVQRYAEEAGFASCEIADIEHPLFRFYLLRAPA
jgi:SAM-dependent methyltransferase